MTEKASDNLFGAIKACPLLEVTGASPAISKCCQWHQSGDKNIPSPTENLTILAHISLVHFKTRGTVENW